MELGKPQRQGGWNLFSVPPSNRTKQAVSYSPLFPAFPSNAFLLFSLGGFKTPNLPLSRVTLEDLSLVQFPGCHQLISYRKKPFQMSGLLLRYPSKLGDFSCALKKQGLNYSERDVQASLISHSHRAIPGIILQDHLLLVV